MDQDNHVIGFSLYLGTAHRKFFFYYCRIAGKGKSRTPSKVKLCERSLRREKQFIILLLERTHITIALKIDRASACDCEMKSRQRSEDLADTNHLPSAEAIVVAVLFFSWLGFCVIKPNIPPLYLSYCNMPDCTTW